jgi:hypothetical protein
MAFDCVPWEDPRGPSCPGCGRIIGKDEPTTIMHFPDDLAGGSGRSGKPWHAECARPYWDKLSGILDLLGRAAN